MVPQSHQRAPAEKAKEMQLEKSVNSNKLFLHIYIYFPDHLNENKVNKGDIYEGNTIMKAKILAFSNLAFSWPVGIYQTV